MWRTWRIRSAALALLMSFQIVPRLARAEDAEEIIAHGVALREQGKDDLALEEFRRAYAINPTPKGCAQMALAEQALGLWVPAEEHLRSAMNTEDPWVARNRRALTQSLGVMQQHLGTLDLRGGVRGADVYVDGARVGTLPLSAKRVEAGRRNVEVRAPGYYVSSRFVAVPPGEVARETIELRPHHDTGSNDEGNRATKPGGEARDKAIVPPEGAVQRTAGWVVLAAGAALVATGVVAQLSRQSAISAYNADGSCPGRGNPVQPPNCDDHVSTASTWQTISLIGFVSGGALAVGGIVLVLTAPSSKGSVAGLSAVGAF